MTSLSGRNRHGIFGTKMRSVIKDANEAGIAAIVDQQFEYADRIRAAGLVPIIEPEVSISSPHKEQAETLLRDAIAKHVEALPADARVMLKITIPTQPGLYGELAADPRVLRVVALSGGYSRDEACALLARDRDADRQLLPRAPRGADRGPDRRGVQRHARALGRGDLPGVGGQAARLTVTSGAACAVAGDDPLHVAGVVPVAQAAGQVLLVQPGQGVPVELHAEAGPVGTRSAPPLK